GSGSAVSGCTWRSSRARRPRRKSVRGRLNVQGSSRGTRPGARDFRSEVGAAQLLEGDDADVDGVTEGAGLRPGLGHADQVRGKELIDVLGTSIADSFEKSLR